MRIISTFKDYYDSIQAYGLDGDRVYVREPTMNTLDLTELESGSPKIGAVDWVGGTLGYERGGGGKARVEASYRIIGFCGRFYAVAAVDYISSKGETSGPSGTYRASDYYHTVESFEEGLTATRERYSRGPFGYYTDGRSAANRLASAYEHLQANCADYEDHTLFRLLDTPIFCRGFTDDPFELSPNWHSYRRNHEAITQPILSNPRLKDFDFAKVKDPYTCFQDISQYLSGVLGSIEKDGTDLSDKQQVLRHGFDEKYGFRTRPKE